ncbi:uncharacterized protein ColSpa_01440 [Colletotrichum spaethianum]|uniref:Secreted protein n=1 Tax=Colletotrichum spaethianum TaxID=700344 RepID=A0AA37L603_9PEZI|nr:uncharacterized protein ColSpa_01440 [Colletotrichum spaethianum]GKT41259.1 hypothetical protein ColSpa_01440 [Colletotrichum spaethianum]
MEITWMLGVCYLGAVLDCDGQLCRRHVPDETRGALLLLRHNVGAIEHPNISEECTVFRQGSGFASDKTGAASATSDGTV